MTAVAKYVMGVPVTIDDVVVGKAIVKEDGTIAIQLGDAKIAENIIQFMVVGAMRGLSLGFMVDTAVQQAPFRGNVPRY